jgi:hypothetical protein
MYTYFIYNSRRKKEDRKMKEENRKKVYMWTTEKEN